MILCAVFAAVRRLCVTEAAGNLMYSVIVCGRIVWNDAIHAHAHLTH
jgi:hypothetical protein